MSFRKILFVLRQFLKTLANRAVQTSNVFLLLFAVGAFLALVYDIGFDTTTKVTLFINNFTAFSLKVIAICYTLKLFEGLATRKSISDWVRAFLMFLLTGLYVFFHASIVSYPYGSIMEVVSDILSSKLYAYILLTFVFVVELSKNLMVFYNIRTNPHKMFIFSYLILIILGAAFLLLPKATTHGISISDAFFTSTSAVCVTGLIVVDTATSFTGLGQVIILFLIQIGGIGVMTFTSFFVLLSDNKLSLQNQLFLKDIVSGDNYGHLIHTLVKIILFTIIIELIGAVFIYLNIYNSTFFTDTYSKMFYSIFHSVSAFCNAGFSSQTDGLHHLATRYNYNIHLLISFLIIIGGLGFPIVFNFYKYLKYYLRNLIRFVFKKDSYHHFPRLINVHTKIVFYTTLMLLVFGFVSYFALEYNHSLKGVSAYGKVVTAFFGSVTPRTAGFNTVDMSAMALPFTLVCIFLMWVGASPYSTGGGIKTTAFAVAILNIISIGKGKNRVEIYKRQVSDESIRNALAVIVLSLFVIGISVFIMTIAEKDKSLTSILFECVSAFSTVGLSLGITSNITLTSKIVLIIAMFIGRIGTLTFFVAFIRKAKSLYYSYPTENIII